MSSSDCTDSSGLLYFITVRGTMGNTGQTGYVGATGTIIDGSTGPTGPTGDIGVVGNSGVRGPDGPIGNQGIKGPMGESLAGDTGGVGVTGPLGPVGPPGSTSTSLIHAHLSLTVSPGETRSVLADTPINYPSASFSSGFFSYALGILTIFKTGLYEINFGFNATQVGSANPMSAPVCIALVLNGNYLSTNYSLCTQYVSENAVNQTKVITNSGTSISTLLPITIPNSTLEVRNAFTIITIAFQNSILGSGHIVATSITLIKIN